MNIRSGWKGIITDMRKIKGRNVIAAVGMLLLAGVLIWIYRSSGVSGSISGDDETGMGETTYSFAMGTSVSVSLYGTDKAENTKIEQAVRDLDEQEISWRMEGSALYQLNHSYTAGEKNTVSDTLYTALTQAYNVCKDSAGALDITIRPLADTWKIESATTEDFQIPDQTEITRALEKTGYESVHMESDKSVVLDKKDMILDLGAVGKGFALDIAEEILKKDAVQGATVSVGGSILVYGEKKDGSSFRVGIRNPQKTAEDMIGYLEFAPGSNTCISTSGDYEKYIEKEGKRYHHILDRNTGYPAESGLASVTVVCQNGLYSDALSTACFVLGYESALPLLEKYNAEAVFIDHENHITVTEGLKNVFHQTETTQ